MGSNENSGDRPLDEPSGRPDRSARPRPDPAMDPAETRAAAREATSRALRRSARIVRTGPIEVHEDPPPGACSDRGDRQRSPLPSDPPLDGAGSDVDPEDGRVSDRHGQVARDHHARQRIARGRRQRPSDAVGGHRAAGQHPGVAGSALELRPGGRLLRDRRAQREHERRGRDRRSGSEADGARRSITAHREQVGSPPTGAPMLAADTFPRPMLRGPDAVGSGQDRHEPDQALNAERCQ